MKHLSSLVNNLYYNKKLYRIGITILESIILNKGSRSLVYVDESGFVEKDQYQRDAWSKKGTVVQGERNGKRGKRESLLLGTQDGKKLAPILIEGTCNTEVFNYWLKYHLLPEVPSGSVIIMDNAAIHKRRGNAKIN